VKKRETGAWECDWAILSLGDTNTGAWPSRLGVGRKDDDLAVQKKSFSRNPKKLKPDAIWQNFLKKTMAQKGLFCQ
jgi:hypothetical protein